jgi:hypothetical protein
VLRESRTNVRRVLQREHRRPQRAFVHPDSARRREGFCIATSATHIRALLHRQLSQRQRTTLPTACLLACEEARRLPTRRARGRIRAPFHVRRTTHRTRLRICERERRIVERIEFVRQSHEDERLSVGETKNN